jgi:hypothetical protein
MCGHLFAWKFVPKFALLLGIVLAVGGCPAVPPAQPPQAMAQWTLIVYVDGDNNLESAALNDFEEMAQIGSTEQVNIVVEMDRAPGYSHRYGDWTETRRFLVGSTSTPADAPLQNLGELNMGDPATLQEFIVWSVQHYPAQHYLLSIWNHGSGWRDMMDRMAEENRWRGDEEDGSVSRAIAFDDTDVDQLYMHEVGQALAQAQAATNRKLDVIGFDACLMGMVEVAYELKDYADYMVASEAVEPDDGWPYDLIVRDLVDAPATEPADLSAWVVQYYVDSYPTGRHITQAAADLSNVDGVAAAIDAFVAAADEWPTLRLARSNTLDYHPGGTSGWGVDLWTFADNVATTAAPGVLQTSAGNLKQAIDAFIIAEAHSADMNGSHGTAIYFPQSQELFDADPHHSGYLPDNAYMPVAFVVSHSWDEWLQTLYAAPQEHGTPPEYVAVGQSGPKQPSATPQATPATSLPSKGEAAGPINAAGGEKSSPEKVAIQAPGSRYAAGDPSAKAPPTVPMLGQGAKQAGTREPEGRYARVTFKLTPEGATPVNMDILPGQLIPSQTIDGDMLYVVTLDDEPVFTGTFRDPLVAVGLPQEADQGYSVTPLDEGYFAVSIPEETLTRDMLALTNITMYRIDPTVPYTYTLNRDTVGELFTRSTPVAQVDGSSLIGLLDQ